VGDLEYNGPVEAMVDKFIMLFVFQSSLKGLDAFGSCKAEHIDQLVEGLFLRLLRWGWEPLA